MAKNNEITTKFKADISQLKSEMQKAKRAINTTNSEFKAISASMDNFENDIVGLTAKNKQLTSNLSNQEKKLSILNKEYEETCKVLGKDSVQAEKLKIEINNQQAEINKTKKELEKYSAKLKDANKSSDILTNTIQSQKKKLTELKEKYALVVKGQGSNSQSAKDLKAQIDKLNTELQDNEKQLKKVQSNSKLTGSDMKTLGNNADQSGTKIKNTGDKIKQLGDKSKQSRNDIKNAGDATKKAGDEAKNSSGKFDTMKIALGNLVAQGISKAIQGMRDMVNECTDLGRTLEYTSAQVKSLLAGSSTDIDADMAELNSMAREVAKNSMYSADEVAQAFKFMGVAGWSASEMMDAINPILNLASANSMDLAQASDIVTDYLTAFGLQSSDAADFCDILSQTARNSNTNVEMLGEAFKSVAPLAGALKFSVEDVSTALGLMANSGIKSSEAGTALKSILSNLSNPTGEIKKAIERLGISLDDGSGGINSFLDIMYKFRESFKNIKTSPDDFNKQLKALDKSFEDGIVTEEQYDKKLQELTKYAFGAEGALQVQNAAVIAGKRGMAALLSIVNTSDDDFNKLSASIYNCAGTAQEMADIQMDTLLGDEKKRDHAWDELKLKISDTLYDTKRDFTQWQTNTLIPFVEDIAVGFTEKVLPKLQEFKDIASDAFETVTPYIEKAGESISKFFKSEEFAEFTQNINEFKDQALQSLSDKFDELKKKTNEFINDEGVKKYFADFGSTITSMVSPAMEDLNTSFSELGESFSGLFKTIQEIAEPIGESLSSAFGGWVEDQGPAELIGGIFSTIAKGIELVVDAFTIVVKTIDGVIQKIKESPVMILLSDAFSHLGEAFSGLLDVLGPIFKGILDIFTSDEFSDGSTNVLVEVLSFVLENVLTIVALLVDGFSSLIDVIGWVIEGIVKFCKDIVKLPEEVVNLFSDIGKLISDIAGDIVDWITDIPKKIKEGLDNIKKKFTDWKDNIKKTVSDTVSNVASSISSWATSLPRKALEAVTRLKNTIVNAIKNLPNTFLSLGSSIITGLWNGIKSGASWLWDNITSLGESIAEGFKDILGIHSPSRVMRDEVGKYIPLGLAEGIQKAKASVYKAMDDISDGLSINVNATGNGNANAVNGQSNTATAPVYNFYQTNNSPKALSRLEIYRNTKRQLAFATI